MIGRHMAYFRKDQTSHSINPVITKNQQLLSAKTNMYQGCRRCYHCHHAELRPLAFCETKARVLWFVSLSGASVLRFSTWGQGAVCEQPRREAPHQTADSPAAPARQRGDTSLPDSLCLVTFGTFMKGCLMFLIWVTKECFGLVVRSDTATHWTTRRRGSSSSSVTRERGTTWEEAMSAPSPCPSVGPSVNRYSLLTQNKHDRKPTAQRAET